MTIEMDPVFAVALRDVLVRRAAIAVPARRRRRRLWIGGALGVVLVGGAGVAAAELRGLPGSELVEPLAEPITVNGVGPLDVDLGPAPEGATAVTFELTCRSAGSFTYGPHGGSSTCPGSDLGGTPSVTSGEIPLADLDGTVFALRRLAGGAVDADAHVRPHGTHAPGGERPGGDLRRRGRRLRARPHRGDRDERALGLRAPERVGRGGGREPFHASGGPRLAGRPRGRDLLHPRVRVGRGDGHWLVSGGGPLSRAFHSPPRVATSPA